MVDIVSIGECFIEFFTYERLHAEADWELVYSGDTFNVLAMANRLGTSCGYVTRISDDPFGDYLLEEWRRRGIDTTHVRQVRGYNAVEFSSSEPVGEGSKVVYRKGAAASTMTPDDIDPAYISGAKILHVSGISQGISRTCRETVLTAVKIAHKSGVLVSYDTNLRVNLWESIAEARDAMDELLPYIDIITPSFPHEPAALIDLHTEHGVIDWFLEQGRQYCRPEVRRGGGMGRNAMEDLPHTGRCTARPSPHQRGRGHVCRRPAALHRQRDGRRRGSAMGCRLRGPQGRRPQHRGSTDPR